MSKSIFTDNPDLKEVYITSDGTPFYTLSDAKNHAKTLKDKNVTHEKNPSEVAILVDDIEEDLSAEQKQVGEQEDGTPITTFVQTEPVQVNEQMTEETQTEEVENASNVGSEDLVQEDEKIKVEPVQTEEKKLTPKQQLQKDYEVKFQEVPAEKFTSAELKNAIASGEKLVAEIESNEGIEADEINDQKQD